MDELNQTMETIEVTEMVDVLPTEEILENDAYRRYGTILGATVAVSAFVGLGVFGYKKYMEWRNSKKKAEEPMQFGFTVDYEDDDETEEEINQED